MRTDRFALADLGQQDRLDEIVTDAARGLKDTFDVNERSNTSTGKSTDGDRVRDKPRRSGRGRIARTA